MNFSVHLLRCPSALFSSSVAGSGAPTCRTCRCLFGSILLARRDRFSSSLQSQISQPLLRPLPPAFPCYPTSDPSGDCTDVHRLWSVASFRANESGAMQGANFETFVLTNSTLSACFNSNVAWRALRSG
ncbi:hypothetical protein BD309DRAFT_321968 [Dichomitus squalens]|uniref:Uncharacterized protein n=1 Tax=Dichomitus squalens TaxID=114155 RepID=A0A4V6MWZ6_9APHY|nr:hypothetical protein BD309DRAFT_321968 [Dichomitus squalens]TBU65098.1 hypothetical protein BD310DRAFT_301037 [Dichomitus squalens]